MKKLRKLVSLLLAVVMIMGLCATQVMAVTPQTVSTGIGSGGTGSITVDNVTEGRTYTVYQLLDLTYDSNNNLYYTISTSSPWYAFFASATNYVTLTEGTSGTYYVTWIAGDDSTTAQALGKLASAYATQNSTSVASTAVSGTVDTGYGELLFTNLPLGYYHVSSSVGSLVELDSTTTAATVVDKNAKPTFSKQVSDAEDGTYSDTSTAAFGDYVYYKITVSEIDETTDLTLHDALPDGFTLDESSVVVKLYNAASGTSSNPQTLTTSEYSVVTSSLSCSDADCDFEISLDTIFGTGSSYTYDTTSYLEITYRALVGTSAAVVTDPTSSVATNTNYAWLTYAGNTTTKDYTNTYIYDLNVYKYTTNATTGTDGALSGAVFKLYYVDATDSTKYYAVVDSSNNLVSWTATETSASTFTSDSTGLIHIEGLDVGTYYLIETEAPTDYAISSSVITVTISAGTNHAGEVSGAEDVTIGSDTYSAIKVYNSTSSEMPSTGGTGVVGYYVFGGILVLAAAAVMIGMRKRKVN